MRPGRAAGPQERIQPRTVEQFGDLAPMVQIFNAPVPQPVERLADILKRTMIPKAEGDSTRRWTASPLCFLPVVYRLWASVRLAHLQEWFCSWVPDSVVSAGEVVSSVDAWYSTTLEIEEVLSNTRQGDFHIFVADVVKSFDTVDRDILDCALGRLGLPAWFRTVYFSFHEEVRLLFELAAGLGVAWTRDRSIPQGCPIIMVFTVALCAPWCRHLKNLRGISPQLYADNLICTSSVLTPHLLLPDVLSPM